MTEALRLWMRNEERSNERRAPISPRDAAWLQNAGIQLTVERSLQRVFPIEDYAGAGCQIAEANSWPDAPKGDVVIGLKELPDQPGALHHRHIYFGHAFKEQKGAEDLLTRFAVGDGELLDLEYVTDASGRRLFAFGHWAGYVGAALAALHWAVRHDGGLQRQFPRGLRGMSKEGLETALRRAYGRKSLPRPRALIIGALGRCGSGAMQALQTAGLEPTCWDIAETANLDRNTLLGHDMLINAVQISGTARPFMTAHDVVDPQRKLGVVVDVTCDVGARCNALPIYDRTTTWAEPVARLYDRLNPLDLIAIDNLPSLLPRESSLDFSAALRPHLLNLNQPSGPWQRSRQRYELASRSLLGQNLKDGAYCDA